jgi:hypothetical protein
LQQKHAILQGFRKVPFELRILRDLDLIHNGSANSKAFTGALCGSVASEALALFFLSDAEVGGEMKE